MGFIPKPEELLSTIKSNINSGNNKKRIVISDNDFGETSDMTGVELLGSIRTHNPNTLLYLSSNQPKTTLKEMIKEISANGCFNPDIGQQELKNIISRDLKEASG